MDLDAPRGEYVILVEGWNEGMEEVLKEEGNWREEALELAKNIPQKEAARQIASKYNLSRREIYQFLIGNAK